MAITRSLGAPRPTDSTSPLTRSIAWYNGSKTTSCYWRPIRQTLDCFRRDLLIRSCSPRSLLFFVTTTVETPVALPLPNLTSYWDSSNPKQCAQRKAFPSPISPNALSVLEKHTGGCLEWRKHTYSRTKPPVVNGRSAWPAARGSEVVFTQSLKLSRCR